MKTADSSSPTRRRGAKKVKADEWPMEIRSGSAVVRIYRQPRAVGDLYTVTHYLDGKRQRQGFAELREAVDAAEKIASRIAKGDRAVFQVSDTDWRVYCLAAEALKETGTSIDVACREYAEARKILGSSSLLEAARSFAKQNLGELTQRMAPEVVEEMIEAKISAGVGVRGISDYKSRLRRFAAAFRCPIQSISKDELQQYLNNLKIAPRTKRNFKANIVTLFDYARSKQYLPRDRTTEAEHLDAIEVGSSEIGVFSPGDFSKLLSAAPSDLVPYLTIRAFAGIRDSEINRMSWKHIKWEESLIEVPAQAAKKTRSKRSHTLRRLVHLQPNLALWLAPYRQAIGRICSFHNSERVARHLADRIKIKWVHNGMRHGYGSYRVAITRNYPEVAYEMGNSVDVIKACYDQVVTPKEAEAWFAIQPPMPEKIIPMPAGKRAAG